MTIAALFALGALYLDLLAPARARALLEHHRSSTAGLGMVFAARQLAGLHASACVAEGDLEAAQRELDAVFDPAMPLTTLAQRHLWYVRAELALARGQAEESRRIVDRLIAAIPAGTSHLTSF